MKIDNKKNSLDSKWLLKNIGIEVFIFKEMEI